MNEFTMQYQAKSASYYGGAFASLKLPQGTLQFIYNSEVHKA